VGVDYFGPLLCKNVYQNDLEDDEIFKCYGVIYTCATSRGVIIDLVPDANAESFILSLSRFISRRGCPKQILSDNGSVFTAKITQSFILSKNILWKFNLVEAPWFGGIWERLVGSIKRCLKKTVSRAYLSFVEMQTLFLEIEKTLNSRPLCSLHDDDVENILTPDHLLFGRSLQQINISNNFEIEIIDVNVSKRSKHINLILQHFWSRWSLEYLTSLRDISINMKNSASKQPNLNDIVIIYEDKQPRNNWRIGKIVELIKSKDNQIRGAKVLVAKTKNIIDRPINRLYPVECANDFKAENKDNRVNNNIRPKRNAAIIADIKRKFND